MSYEKLTASFPWGRYSKRLQARIEAPRNIGSFSPEESIGRGMRLVKASQGSRKEGNQVQLFWLVDPEDGKIVDAKCHVFGQSALIGVADVACDLVVGKNYDQAQRVSADLLDKQLRDKGDDPALPPETAPHLNIVLEAIDACAEQCMDIPLPTSYVALPAPPDIGEVVEGGYPGWQELTERQKIALIEQLLDRDIRPYVALDGGGVEVKELKGVELIIAYQGNCTSCFASMGTTLSYIQQVLRAKLDPALVVVPDLSAKSSP